MSYEGIGTLDCLSFGHSSEIGKKAFEAQQHFRQQHPEIKNVIPLNDLHSWLNNPACTVDACVPLLRNFCEKYQCPYNELLNLVQRCIIQSSVESAYRMHHVAQTHQLYYEGKYEMLKTVQNNPTLAPPIWQHDSPNSENSNKHDKNVTESTSDSLLLDSVTKLPPFKDLTVTLLHQLCKKFGIKKYTGMNKESMVNVLTLYKENYNNIPYFRFQHFYKQEKCNANGCNSSKNLQNVSNLKWKYCNIHIKTTKDTLLDWDNSVNTTFLDVHGNKQLSIPEASAKFQSKSFENIITSGEHAVSMKMPFPLSNEKVKKLAYTKPTKAKSGNIRSNMIKNRNNTKKISSSSFMKEEGTFSSTIEADDVFDEPEIDIDLDSKINNESADNHAICGEEEEDESVLYNEEEEELEDENVENEIIETEDESDDDSAISSLKRDHSHVLSKSSKKMKC